MSEAIERKNILPQGLTWNEVYSRMSERPNETQYLVDYEGGQRVLYVFDYDYVKKQVVIA